jgi:superfamily II DNA or RNA helicase
MPSLVDRLTPEVVFAWVPDALTDDARGDVERGRVARPAISTSAIRAVVVDDRLGPVEVRIVWALTGPVSSCECGAGHNGACRHAAAVGLMLVGDAVPGRAAGREGPPTQSIAEREREVRQGRGASELFTVTPRPGTAVYGAYGVESPSSRSYEVVIRALDEPHNGCTCPDLATNLLGTCKHIEAVLHRLRQRSAKRFARMRDEGPPASYLHLGFGPEPEVRLRLAAGAAPAVRRVRARFFRADGRLAAAHLEGAWPELHRAAESAGVAVPREVASFVERVRDAAERARKERAVEAEVKGAGRDQPGFRATLYPYQVEGVAFLASRGRALLADDMGLGKTAQAIAAMLRLARKDGVCRTLVVCPASLKRQWEREIERFTGMGRERVRVVTGPREVRQRMYADPPEVLITSYELARADERELVSLAPDLLILDEAQRIKNWRTRTADAVKRIPSRYAFVLTGTPLENRLDDLYSLVQVIDPHRFGPLWRFNDDFTDLDERGRVVGYKNLDLLRRRVGPVMLRRRKEDVLPELPSRLVNRISVPMTQAQLDVHVDSYHEVTVLLAKLKKRPLTPQEEKRLLRAFQRMRMACDAIGLVDKETVGSPKLTELAGLLDEICIQGGHKVVVFSEWERMQAMAAEVCDKLGIGHVRLHGGVPSDARGKLIDRFFSDADCKVFFSTDAGGVGLNLQVASHVVNLDLPWNPAVLAQRIARVHRIGQRSAVNVVLLVSEDSFEEKLETNLVAKRALFAAAVGDDETTTEVSRSTLASRIATLMGGEFAAATGAPTAGATQAAPAPANDVEALRARLGDALERVVRLPDGRLLGVVRGDGAPPADEAAVLLPAGAAAALAPLGDASPLSRAELLYRAEPAAALDPIVEARRVRLSAAERKLAAAAALTAAGLGGEALGMLREALAFGCRAACASGDPGEEHAALLSAVYGALIPGGVLTPADAHALVRAGELARAFGGSAATPPEAMVAELAREARDLLARVRERIAEAASAPASGVAVQGEAGGSG